MQFVPPIGLHVNICKYQGENRGDKTVMNLDLDYFYSIEAEQFAFFRIPKVLINNEMYKGISNAAKLL